MIWVGKENQFLKLFLDYGYMNLKIKMLFVILLTMLVILSENEDNNWIFKIV